MQQKLSEIAGIFGLPRTVEDVRQIVNGHINTTYLVTINGRGYIFQQINTYVFKNPVHIMENIRNVTTHLRRKISAEGGDPERGTLNFLYDGEDKNYYIDGQDSFWRVCPYIENTSSYEQVESLDMLRSAAYGFGRFQSQLADFPMNTLHETIPDFHNTKKRLDDFFGIVNADSLNRAASVKDDIAFFRERYETAGAFQKMLENKSMPLRVTHNDTKYNNILIDNATKQAVCVIDLDTVMPGLSVYDFGDAIRFAASTAMEDETDLDQVTLNMNYFEAFAKGFMSALDGALSPIEVDNMAQGCINITVELASRFLADHINGDKYFRIHRPNHNLERARNQMRLAREMERKLPKMNQIVRQYV